MKTKIGRAIAIILSFLTVTLATGLSIVLIVNAANFHFDGPGTCFTVILSLVAGVIGGIVMGCFTE